MPMERMAQKGFFSFLLSLRRQRSNEPPECKLIADSGLFDRTFYLSAYPDVAQTGIDPVLHYVLHGNREGRNPSAVFNTRRYRHRHNLPQDQNSLAHYILQRTNQKTVLPNSPGNILEWRLELDEVWPTPAPIATEIGIFVHLFYEDLAKDILGRLVSIPFAHRIYISTDTTEKERFIRSVLMELSIGDRAIVKVIPDGGDIEALLVGFAQEIEKHEICLKLHARKSSSRESNFEDRWRRHLLSELVGHSVLVARTVAQFLANKDLGVVMPSHWDGFRDTLDIGSSFNAVQALLGRLDVSIQSDQWIEYPSGSMFWFRSKALAPLLKLNFGWEDFRPDEAEPHATLAHAIERSLLFCVAKGGFRWASAPGRRILADITDEECTRLIRESGDFDTSYYLQEYDDVAQRGWDPIEHYVKHGWPDRRNPSAHFHSRYYESLIAGAGYTEVNPLVHYIVIGKSEGRIPQRKPKTPATIAVDDLYSAYKKVESTPTYVEETRPIIRRTTVKPIAFYFPQFHPFEENDRFWGRGFTEWTNTTKALPMFAGHHQPRLPGELGFYDTRVRDVLVRQMELARQYGIYGFCLHHYFFDGKPVMRAPYEHILADKSLDLPFCLHWANEPWTVRWDGLARMKGTLLDQRHSPEDDIAFFKDIEPAITDPRYITVAGRPLLVIYRPSLFPDIRATIDRWKACCRAIGVQDLFLVMMQTSFEANVDPQAYGFDAAIEYPPHHLAVAEVSHTVSLYDPAFEGQIFDYRDAMKKALARPDVAYTRFRGIMPDWDCTPRRANPALYIHSSPSLYQAWLEGLCRKTQENLSEDRQFIFINAWNEWAEGAYLEPDRRHGYGYLNATAKAMNASGLVRPDDERLRILIGAHIFYTDLLPEFVDKFRNVGGQFDLLITTPHDKVEEVRRDLAKALAGVRVDVIGVGPIGRDFAPFIFEFMPRAAAYDICCWVHSKKSLYDTAYAGWRDYLLRNLLGSPGNIAAILDAFAEDNGLGVVYPAPFTAVASKVEWGSNYELAGNLLARLDITVDDGPPRFPTAAMFWFRPKALEGLTRLDLTIDEFARHADGARDPKTNAVIDGTISHALERMIIYVVEASGYHAREILFEH